MAFNKLVRVILLSLLLLSLVGFAACDFKTAGPSGPGAEQYGIRVGDVAADFTLLDRRGVPVRLSEFEGDVILLDISTMWCHFCKKEAETAEEMYQQYRGRGFVTINVLFQDFNGGAISNEACDDWADVYGLSFPVLLDPDESIWRLYNEQDEMPLNLVIDRDFIIRHKATGYNDTAIRQKIESLL